ncbi:MAG: hypothetical protein ACM3YM_09400 [Sphingomonadales bacterium]
MGWVFAIFLGILTFVALWLSGRCSRMALEMAAAALLVALAGYGWQGSPDIPGQPVHRTGP